MKGIKLLFNAIGKVLTAAKQTAQKVAVGLLALLAVACAPVVYERGPAPVVYTQGLPVVIAPTGYAVTTNVPAYCENEASRSAPPRIVYGAGGIYAETFYGRRHHETVLEAAPLVQYDANAPLRERIRNSCLARFGYGFHL
ncbi:hypothetical protein [Paludibacterium sp.]|uniref:hypothetical protein n=1 Tax=Paludibacterium sp. TaxID=1917523 RepID=UPI0025DCF2D1|nr:hypothetical protein [Paludibacterium sp.]MBV8649617.1 hypothetical protein [Paludibacterium sp.]